MIKFTEEQLEALKELIAELGSSRETKRHRKYGEFFYKTVYTIKDEDVIYFEDETLFDKVKGLTIMLSGYWSENEGLFDTSIGLTLQEEEKDPDFLKLELYLNKSEGSVPDHVIKYVLDNFPQSKYKITIIDHIVGG